MFGFESDYLTVVGTSPIKRDLHLVWECLCKCGQTIFLSSGQLKSGNNRSCGCLARKGITSMIGKRYGRLVVIEAVRQKERLVAKCQCDCGAIKLVGFSALRGGLTRSCGCLRREITSQSSTTHGMSHTPIYNSWRGMRERCENHRHKDYHSYGGRGIRVCVRWFDFGNFLQDMGHTWTSGMTIERNDTNGNYEAENCRWATIQEQVWNKRCNRFFEYQGKRLNIPQLASIAGITKSAFKKRLRLGWTVERAVTTPHR